MVKRKILLASILAVLALLIAIPASAITFGELDGERHPNVGALVIVYEDGTKDIVCTGTLISPTVFLTAAHCVDWMPDYGIAPDEVYVTFDTSFDQDSPIYPGTYYFPPDAWHDISDPKDVAVVVLDSPITDIAPASLPTANLLTEMKAAGELKDQTFVAVGYGTLREDKTGGSHSFYWDPNRRFVEQSYLALTKAWLKLSMNPSTGNGGTCYGDSGGPHFLGDTGMVVAVTVTGDATCRATDVDYRLDTASARDFLGQFVTLP
jgi:secreted trypsin-like serine protease